ncbi:hypothetical protein B0H15DRAFT_793050 [Mycena belliarum]|uniref:Uncharacterized protein n=1 Tax=Mycena belliarum TaxID=1033014 RepID=A0AAD6XED8_9AGAR|nr:hypothetical protein B0H15DRAFT_793050 [Mycena belliae]
MHPFIGVAVIAFKAVVSLELKRRDNDDSVLTLLVKMEDMMGELLLLKIIEPDALRGGKTVAATLSGVCTLIAEDIKNCGNLCDKYSKTSFCGKLLKSPLYNERFSKFIQLFETWMRELDRKLGLFTAITVHSLSVSMDQVYTTLQSNNEHMKTLILLQRLQSPLEQKILKAIKRHGGSEACMADDKIIEELIAMTPQYVLSFPSSRING